MIAAVVLTWSGCVLTADCDQHVGCPDDGVCYQRQCLDRCETTEDCRQGEVCEPCRPEGTTGEGRCFGDQGSACLEAAEAEEDEADEADDEEADDENGDGESP